MISVDGNATLHVTMTDKGEPGTSDMIGITVWNKDGGMWFSSNWSGTQTIEQVLAGGNLKVSANSSFSTGGTQSPATSLTLTTSRNPSVYGETVTFTATIKQEGKIREPKGKVSFSDGATVLGIVHPKKKRGMMVVKWSTASLAVGEHKIKAKYQDDGNRGNDNDVDGITSFLSDEENGEADSLTQKVITTLANESIGPYDKTMPGRLQVSAYPNPSSHVFTLVIKSNRDQPVMVRIMDVWGRVKEVRNHVAPNGTIEVGQSYLPGTYFAEVVQGSDRATVKLIKQSD